MSTTAITAQGREWAAACGIDPIEPLVFNDVSSAFAAQLRGWMGEQKLTAIDLARVLGVTTWKARSIHRGTSTITMATVAGVAAWQGKSPAQLLAQVEALRAESKKAVSTR